ncbi:PEP/pyruvate-binding domain-containing protein [Thermodesulfobacteriota bacterium]
MNPLLPLEKVTDQDRPRVGGKAFALARMAREGIRVPRSLCVGTEAYRQYARETGLEERILLELYRKPFEEMRWEEVWDTALRVRNLFLKTPIPAPLEEILSSAVESFFKNIPVSVRSSAPGEDSAKTSFAGLHESFLNVQGTEAILEHIRLVWASLWSDRALLYRKELGLDVKNSAMAVVVQELVSGDRSGVVFGQSPVDATQSVVEAVYGLNQGLVDGTVEPDRWVLDRESGKILTHNQANREKAIRPAGSGVRFETLDSALRERPPLDEADIGAVYGLAMKMETLFGSPQDVEWTIAEQTLHALQARPITTGTDSGEDDRPYYMGLHRSFENLKVLGKRIEEELIPAMEASSADMETVALPELSDLDLAHEIERRTQILEKWQRAYHDDCIPFAHGMRLFGQVYNDVMKPEDPFGFIEILRNDDLVSVQRNSMIEVLADSVRKAPRLADCLEKGDIGECDPEFQRSLDKLVGEFGDMAWGERRFAQDKNAILAFILEMASHKADTWKKSARDRAGLEKAYFDAFEESQRTFAAEMLDLGRQSYRLRDDDNIYLGRVEGQVLAALEEGKKRLSKGQGKEAAQLAEGEVIKGLQGKAFVTGEGVSQQHQNGMDTELKARQIVGQPAGHGIATGKARVILEAEDLFLFKAGEILVCDAVEPNMTFVVPLAGGVVERRGGMLIHGAIIAREYGIPCVTGVPEAAKMINTGDTVTVDGYLGIVIIGEGEL